MTNLYHGIQIDESRSDSLETYSKYLVQSHYAKENETIQQALARPSICWSSNLAHAQRLYDYASRGLFMYASPTFSNAVIGDEKPKSLPISCFLPYVGDSVPDLLFQKAEFALLSVMGGGVGQYWGHVRPVSKKAPGPIPFIHENDGGILAWKQGSLRRGALAAYLDADHPDAAEFLKIRIPTGDSDRKSLNIHHGFNFSDAFMEAIENGTTDFPLTNPSNGKVEGTVDPRQFFIETVTTRARTGEPFIHNIDTVNNALPLPQRMLGLSNKSTNLCTEITLAADKDRTPVCCLSSLNLAKIDEIMNEPLFISDLIEMLDNVIEYFINNVDNIAENYADQFDKDFIKTILSKVKYSAFRERSIGLGAMGYHHMLQSKGIPFESEEALELNDKIFAYIKEQAHEASCRLGKEKGVAPDIADYIKLCEEKGIEVDEYWRYRRNLHLLAIAPNANNSVILATSPGIETVYANIYSQDMRTGIFPVMNRYLKKLLSEKYNKDTIEVWDSIADNNGSVQHLDFLTDRERMTFKNAMEIDQEWVIRHAAVRQPHICQSQSVNVFFPPASDINHVVRIHFLAWKLKLKSLYYYRTQTEAKIERLSKMVKREEVEEVKKTIVYGTSVCPQCTAAKAMLDAKNIPYEYIDLNTIGKTAAEVTGRPVRSIPQIYIQGEYIGGFTELMSHLSKKVEDESTSGSSCVACEG